jgi:hypothetical protein
LGAGEILGLTLHNARILLSFLATGLIVGLTVYGAVKWRGAMHEPPPWFALAVLGSVGLWLLSVVLGFLGSIFCLFVPSGSSARFVLALALLLDVVTVPLCVVAAILGWTPLTSWATGLCSWAFFMVFLIRLAAYLDRPGEAREGQTTLFYGLVLITLPMVLGGQHPNVKDT